MIGDGALSRLRVKAPAAKRKQVGTSPYSLPASGRPCTGGTRCAAPSQPNPARAGARAGGVLPATDRSCRPVQGTDGLRPAAAAGGGRILAGSPARHAAPGRGMRPWLPDCLACAAAPDTSRTAMRRGGSSAGSLRRGSSSLQAPGGRTLSDLCAVAQRRCEGAASRGARQAQRGRCAMAAGSGPSQSGAGVAGLGAGGCSPAGTRRPRLGSPGRLWRRAAPPARGLTACWA
jgi:hypothetical protein